MHKTKKFSKRWLRKIYSWGVLEILELLQKYGEVSLGFLAKHRFPMIKARLNSLIERKVLNKKGDLIEIGPNGFWVLEELRNLWK